MNTTTESTNLLDASDDDLKAMGLPPAFTLEELQAALSDEEIAKLAEGDDPLVKLPDAPAKAEAGEDDPDDSDDEKGETGDDDGDEDKGDDDDKAEAEAGDAAKAAEPAAAAPADDTPDPVYQPRDVSQAKAVIDGAAEEKRKLRESWSDGDLSDDEYQEKLEALADHIADAKAELKDAEREEARAIKEVEDAWFGKVDRFLEANPVFRSNDPIPELQGNSYLTMLDTALKSIARDQRYAGMSMNQRIEAGAQMVRAYVQQQTGADIPGYGQQQKPAKEAKDKADQAREAAKDKAAKQGKRPDPVQTLGNVTAATETEADDSKFAAIDREKSGLDREREFSRLSPEEQEAYLKGL
ncbi:hypothetical protein LOS78_01815 [Paracoccus sp. MA]|uniref:hypothetical protein n=1 Tax=Paracoccus sp. MA TaxID=2895796 RepID=UPI001E36B064|nr:hypothetical protein [Paracoccus sp. MA]UFM64236.1 hypothetical protein LOS78_01815 [Paracoccus sp. MA]